MSSKEFNKEKYIHKAEALFEMMPGVFAELSQEHIDLISGYILGVASLAFEDGSEFVLDKLQKEIIAAKKKHV